MGSSVLHFPAILSVSAYFRVGRGCHFTAHAVRRDFHVAPHRVYPRSQVFKVRQGVARPKIARQDPGAASSRSNAREDRVKLYLFFKVRLRARPPAATASRPGF